MNEVRMSREQTAETRARILAVAGKLFRERGFDGIGVADLMKSAGLTHGAFYNHFESKQALASEVSEDVLKQTTCAWSGVAGTGGGGGGFEAFVATYLSKSHRDDPAGGCLIAALGGDVARQEPSVRRAFTSGLRPMIEFFARHATGRSSAAKRERALVTLATLVGTVVLARAVDDEDLSEELLQAARVALKVPSQAQANSNG
jgi:TetR/AcrR family transcriptional regulator, transcriptional repressor for nem operon